MMANPSVHFRKLIEKYQCVEGLAINKMDLLKKCQTWQLLMVEPSIVAMFVKLCIYGRNLQSEVTFSTDVQGKKKLPRIKND